MIYPITRKVCANGLSAALFAINAPIFGGQIEITKSYFQMGAGGRLGRSSELGTDTA